MKILWVKMGGLWPPTTGGRVRSLQIVSELSRRHAVTLVTTHADDDAASGLEARLPDCRVISLPYEAPKLGSRGFPLAVARSWCSRDPVEIWRWRVPAVQQRVAGLEAESGFDLCIADFLLAFGNVGTLRRTPVVLFEHNVEYMIWRRLAEVEPSRWRRALMDVEWRKLRRAEAAACARAGLTLAVSDADRAHLQTLAPSARMATIPTGVDTTYFAPAGAPPVRGRLIFTGSMDWPPNEDATVHFADSILPRIRAACPHVSLTVAGRNPTPRLRALAAAHVIQLTGTVDDVRPYVDEAEVYVTPIRAGSGTRLKIFEAFAMGKAVVSTTIGAEGLAVTPGQDIVLADDPEPFAQAVVSLLQDDRQRAAIGRAARTLVETHYSWPQIAAEFEARCEEALRPARLADQAA